GVDAVHRGPGFVDVDDMVGPETFGQFQPWPGCAEDNDLRCAGALGHREGRDADRAGALNDHDVTPGNAGAFDAVDGGVQRAARANDRLRGQVLRQLENGGARPQVMELRVAAEEMRRRVAPVADAVGASRGATRGQPLLRAVIAGAAGRGRVPRHAVADLERLPGPIRVDSLAQLLDAANGFVSQNNR